MTQKEKLENATGVKMPEPTEQENFKEPIEGTPFWIIQDNTGYNLIMGKYKLNRQPISSLKQMNDWMNDNPWNITMDMIICIVNDIINNQNKQ